MATNDNILGADDLAVMLRVPPAAAAAALPTDLTFTQVRRQRYVTPHAPFQTDFLADFQINTVAGLMTKVSGTTAATVLSGELQFENLAGADNIYTVDPVVPTVPYFFMSADYSFSGDASTQDQVRLGLYKDTDNKAMAFFDKKAGTVGVAVRLSATDRFVTNYAMDFTGYTKFGCSITGNQISTWAWNGKAWTCFRTEDMSPYVNFLTDLSGWKYAIQGRSNGTVKQKLSNFRISPFGGSGLRDLKFVTYEDGSPIIDGGKMFLTATVAAPNDTTGRCMQIGIFSFDYLSYDMRQVGRLTFSDANGQFGGAAAKILFDRGASVWWVFVSTYGSATAGTPDVGFIKCDACPLFGSQVLSGLTLIPSSHNDADLWFDGALWHLVYNSAATTPAYRTAPTIPGLVDATPVALGTSTEEGNNLRIIGGVAYWMSIDKVTPRWPIRRLSDRTQIGYLSATFANNSASAHPNVIAVPVVGGTKYLIVSFAGGSFQVTQGTSTYGNGDVTVFESQIVAGKEFADPIRLA